MYLEDVQAHNELQQNKTGKSQPSIDEIVDLTWGKKSEQLQNKNTTILNTESSHIQTTNNKASAQNKTSTNNK